MVPGGSNRAIAATETFISIIKAPKTFLVVRLNKKLQSLFSLPKISADCGPDSRVQSYTQECNCT